MAKATKDSSSGKCSCNQELTLLNYKRRVDIFLGEIWHAEESHRDTADHTLKLIEEFLTESSWDEIPGAKAPDNLGGKSDVITE